MFYKKSREKDVFELFHQHTLLVNNVLNSLMDTVDLYLKDDPKYEKKSYQTHTFEHEADSIENAIRKKLFEGAFLQGIRNDMVALAIKIDKIASTAVTVARKLVEEKPLIPKELKEDILQMCSESVKVAKPLETVVSLLKVDVNKLEEPCEEIRKIEKDIDSYFHKILVKLFALDIELAHKIQLRDWIIYIHNISDIAEDITDIISILSMNLII